MFSDFAAVTNLENRFVTLVALLVKKGVFTMEEFDETVTAFEAVMKTQEYRDELLRAAREKTQKKA